VGRKATGPRLWDSRVAEARGILLHPWSVFSPRVFYFKEEEMKPLFVAMMAATFVLGMGFVGVIFILAKITVHEMRTHGPGRWNDGMLEQWNNGYKRNPKASSL
jgi:hypothetical protein